MKSKKVNAIEYDKEGNPIFNLGASAANDDWIRAARLKREGKFKELEELQNTEMSYVKFTHDELKKLDNENT